MQRAKRAAYLTVVTLVTTFLGGLFLIMVVETLGPSETADGRVIERIEGERTVTRCYGTPGNRCSKTTYPTYSVIGERADGTAWIVVGEGAYDAMRGERGVIRVETSNVTGRVVGLAGNDSFDNEWSVTGSGVVWFSIGALVIWIPLVVAYEWRRRGGFFDLGELVWGDLGFAVLGLAVGAIGLWFVTWSKTASLDVASSEELYGDFLADPLSFIGEAGERNDRIDQPGIQLGEFFEAGQRTRVVTVAIDQLGDPPALGPDDPIAIPVLRLPRFDSLSSRDRVELTLVQPDGSELASTECAGDVLAFPTPLGVDDEIQGGFVCFPPGSEGELRVIVGSGVFADAAILEHESLP